MSALADKIRRSREQRVELGGFVFVVRRPTDVDMAQLYRSRQPTDFLRFVVGWEKVREMDLIPGGDPHPAPFDADACTEWLQDRGDLLTPLIERIGEIYQEHKARLEAAEKN